jgi:hypothetical protein
MCVTAKKRPYLQLLLVEVPPYHTTVVQSIDTVVVGWYGMVVVVPPHPARLKPLSSPPEARLKIQAHLKPVSSLPEAHFKPT